MYSRRAQNLEPAAAEGTYDAVAYLMTVYLTVYLTAAGDGQEDQRVQEGQEGHWRGSLLRI